MTPSTTGQHDAREGGRYVCVDDPDETVVIISESSGEVRVRHDPPWRHTPADQAQWDMAMHRTYFDRWFIEAPSEVSR